MAVTVPTKQTLHHAPALIALGEALHFLPHHTKPFRRRHILLLLLSIAFLATMFLELAVIVTRRSLDPRLLFSSAATQVDAKQLRQVTSSLGYALVYDSELFTATALGQGSGPIVSEAVLKKGEALTQVTLSPLPSRVPAQEAAAVFDIRVEIDEAAFATYKAAVPAKTDITGITADYFAPQPTNLATITEESRTTESIGGSLMTKTTYVVTPKFAGKPSRTIVWAAQVNNRPLAISLKGLVGSGIPTSMTALFQSVSLDTDSKVEGISDLFKADPPSIDQKYVADLISPAVVKVYHIVCGSLVYQGAVLSDDTCSGVTGSGFIVSEDGYIATNGHVVVYGAKDMLANALLANPALLEQFLVSSEMTTAEITEVINRPELTASVVAKIYDLPNADLRLINQRERTVVATGNTPVTMDDEAAVKKLVAEFKNSDDLKQATVVSYDYSAKDQLTIVADPESGFSASDVALLKIDIDNAPLITMTSEGVVQNQKLMLLGFPSDADNELTDNSELALTVTNGSISSIRDAAGGKSKLYQSDADASHGSSGGPAVNEDGEAFGLLTYRFESGEVGDAAKSYIRGIEDFTALVSGKNITLNTVSSTQAAWEKGLSLYGKQQYTAALVQFQTAASTYPSHRLAEAYVDMSKKAISEGKNVQEPSTSAVVAGIIGGSGLLIVAVVLISRHFGHHRVYRTFHRHHVAVR
jgi:serine protease Do